MTKLAIVMASNGKAVGGMEKQVALQAQHLATRDQMEVSVFAHKAYRSLFPAPVRFCEIKMQRSRRNPLLKHQLLQSLKALNPCLVHAHGHKAVSLINTLNKRLPNIPFVATAHGTKKDSQCFTRIDLVFAVSKGVQQSLLPIPSQVIGNAVEKFYGPQISKQALCEKYQLDFNRPLLIASGRLSPVKQYDRLMRACQQLEANLLVFGDGPERSKLSILQTPSIHLAGHSQHMQANISAADALVISSAREGFSLSMIEALQQETPVLSTPVSGTDLLPKSGIIDASTDEELRRSLHKKLALLPQIKADSASAFCFANKSCTPEALVDYLVKQYHALLSSNTGS